MMLHLRCYVRKLPVVYGQV